MKRLIGNFYFMITNNGNLLGEFFNNNHNIISTEHSVRITEGNNFEGTYFTSWIERDSSINATLTITQIQNTNLFDLNWNNQNVVFIGKGQIVNEMLIGYYFLN